MMPTAPSSKICRRRAMLPEANPAIPARVGLSQLLATFVRLGTMTFGGGVQSWIHREVVERLGWINDKSFLSGMTVAQVLPGANPVNMALYVGLQLRGGMGAAVAVFGMLMPAFCTTLMLGALYRSYGHFAAVHFVLAGMAAAGVGATLTMGIQGRAASAAQSRHCADRGCRVCPGRCVALAHDPGGRGDGAAEHCVGIRRRAVRARPCRERRPPARRS